MREWVRSAERDDAAVPAAWSTPIAVRDFGRGSSVRALGRHGVVGSMGRVGEAGDNAVMESFFGLLQNNVLHPQSWAGREELRIAIVTWIERTYYRRRRRSGLGRLTPIEYETIMTSSVALTA